MRETNVITRAPAPNLNQKADIKFQKSAFDTLVWNNGYEVYHDKMIECPCKPQGAGGFKSDCKNCGGYGWVMIERINTKMVIQSMNMESKYKEWSLEKIGTAGITSLGNALLSHMDRIILINTPGPGNCGGEIIADEISGNYKQLIYPTIYPAVTGSYFSFLTYYAVEVQSVHRFISSNEVLELIDPALYNIDENKIIFNPSLNTPWEGTTPTLSIRYSYLPQYHIVDINREQMIARNDDEFKNTTKERFPLHAIGVRSHLLPIDKFNYNKDNFVNNT